MIKIFDVDFRKGTLIDSVSGVKGTFVAGDGGFKRTEKGIMMYGNYTSITYPEMTLSSGRSLFISISANTFSNNPTFIGQGAGKNYIRFDASSVIRIYGSSSTITFTYNFKIKTKYLIEIRLDGISSHLYVNGNLEQTKAFTDEIDFANVFDDYTSRQLDGYIGRCILIENVTTDERNKLYQEFLHSQGTVEEKRNFIKTKPTDLSKEVDSNAELVFNDEFENDTWTEGEGWSYDSVNKRYTHTPTTTDDANLAKTSILTNGETYYVTYKVNMEDDNTGWFRVYNGISVVETRYTSGTYTDIIEGATPHGTLYIRADNLTKGSIEFLSIVKKKGLVAAYNMVPSNGKLIDISGNGHDGTINRMISTKDGLRTQTEGDDISFSTLLLDENTEWGVHCRVDNFIYTGNVFFMGNGSSKPALVYSLGGIMSFYHGSAYLEFDGTGDTIRAVSPSDEVDIIFTSDGTNVYLYINGISYGYVTPASTILSINNFLDPISVAGIATEIELKDVKIYNKYTTPKEALDYHNSFQEITLRETFSDAGADGINKIPRGWN